MSGTILRDGYIKAKETLEKLAETKQKADITTLKERIEKILEESDKKIVVIMDDIDRLDKEEIQSVFRLIKLSADFPNTIYLLSFDIDRVSEALAEKYGSKESGRSFLEKIIQLSLPLPPLPPDKLIELTFNEINKLLTENNIDLNESKDAEWSYFFRTNFGYYLKSPRLVKKYINNLWFSIAYNKDELNILDLQTIEAIHTFFPNLYESIRSNKNVFLMESLNPWFSDRENNEQIEKLKGIINSFPEQNRETIRNILRNMFPQTISAFSNSNYGNNYDHWSKEKRISSPTYFHRYFNIGISSDDISDIELKEFVYNLKLNSIEKNINKIKEFISNNRENLFLLKLSWLVDSLEENTVIELSKVITKSGHLFSKGHKDSFAFRQNPFSDAARLLVQLLKTVNDKNKQITVAIDITSMASTLEFADEFFRFVRHIKDETRQLAEDELTELGKVVRKKVAERIEKEIQEKVLEEAYPHSFGYLYFDWLLEKPENVKAYLAKRFKQKPQDATDFILCFAQNSWDVNNLAQFWGFDFIVSAIEKTHTNLELPSLDSYSKDSIFRVGSKEQYLAYFVSIAKLLK